MKSLVFMAVLVGGCVATMPDDPTVTADLAWGTAGALSRSRKSYESPCGECGGSGVIHVQSGPTNVCRSDDVPSDAVLIVTEVREGARVAINGGDTEATGRIRRYMARNIAAGKEYEFVVRVDDETRTVTLSAGEQANLSFVQTVQTCPSCGGCGIASRSILK